MNIQKVIQLFFNFEGCLSFKFDVGNLGFHLGQLFLIGLFCSSICKGLKPILCRKRERERDLCIQNEEINIIFLQNAFFFSRVQIVMILSNNTVLFFTNSSK